MIFFCIPGPDDQNWWNRKNCPKFFHRVIFAFWIQICNPNLCKSHIFWNTANTGKWPFFCIPRPDDQNRGNRKNCPKFFHRVIFACWIQICNPNLCKSHIFWIFFFFFYEWEYRTGTMCPFSSLHPLRKGKEV